MKPKTTHGGARPGAGRPRKAAASFSGDARTFLHAVMRGEIDAAPAQIQAAKALLRLDGGGVKAERQRAAEHVVAGRSKPMPTPPLANIFSPQEESKS
jgi:hypothetical protein